MPAGKQMTFGQFRLDAANECLWQGAQPIRLRPKAFAVLKHLIEHPGQLVTKQQLLEAVWPATFVTDAVLKDSIRQLREALGDDADSPRYIETAHRRGYRFIAQLSAEPAKPTPRPPPRESSAHAPTPVAPGTVGLLGRDVELRKMSGCLERALLGERQTVFVTGEPGIGKTTLVNAVLDQAATVPDVWIARGQCLEHYGAGEAYLPVLDGISRLARTPRGARVIDLLRQHAPAWLLEMPSLLPAGERDALRSHLTGPTRERMLREMAEAMEAMSAESPLILVLEDLHWSDYSTLDLIAFLARRRDPARLVVIGTYRPVDVILSDHPLKAVKRELQAHGLCQELALEYLTEEVVGQFVAARFPGHHLPPRLARLIHRRTEGNPLFMVHLVDYLVDEQVIAQSGDGWVLRGGLRDIDSGIPENVRELIETQIERLGPDERTVLEGASVVGMECSSVAIGAGLDQATGWVEERCEALVRRHHFLSPARVVELPDGTITPRYKFAHVLYLEVPYRLLPAMRRAQIHLRVGRSGEAIYGSSVGEIAAELAMHFEQGHDNARAVKYLLMAAENAAHRCAYHEAEALVLRGLQALESLPPSDERDRQELGLRMGQGAALMTLRGFAASGVKDVYERALELCARLCASPQAFMVQWLLGLFHYFRAELQPAREIAEQLVQSAERLEEPVFLIEAECGLGVTLLELGRSEEAAGHLDTLLALCKEHPNRQQVSFSGRNPEVVGECFRARALWLLGHPDQALKRIERALSLAKTLLHAESSIVVSYFASQIHQLRGEASLARERAEFALAAAEEYGYAVWVAAATMNVGWARVVAGDADKGIQDIRRGLAAYEATGTRLWRAYFLGVLAEALGNEGRIDEGVALVSEALALVQETGEHWSTAELHRIHGELRLAQKDDPTPSEIKEYLSEALSLARQQHAKSWELRTVSTLGRWYQRQGKPEEARQIVSEVYEWFGEGFETADLTSANVLLAELSRPARRSRR